MADYELPDSYTRLTALYHKGTGALNLSNLQIQYTTDMVVELETKLVESVGSISYQSLFTEFFRVNYACQFFVLPDFSSMGVRGSGTGGTDDITRIDFAITNDVKKKFKLVIDVTNNKVKINSTEYDVNLQSVMSDSYSNSMYLYHANSGSSYLKAYLYGFKLYQRGALICNLIPCIDSDDYIGLYDTVSTKFIAVSKTYWEAYRDSETDLEEAMIQRGLEQLAEHIRFVSIDGTIITEDKKYVYGKDFNIGDYVTVYSKKMNKYFNLQITSVSKSISNGVEYLDIGFGEDRIKVADLK